MTVTIQLAPDEERILGERAAAAGQDVPTFIRNAAIEKAGRLSLGEVLASVHNATERAGATIDEIDAMADRARDEVRQERRAARAAKTS